MRLFISTPESRDGALWGVLGTPGADNQVQVNLQALIEESERPLQAPNPCVPLTPTLSPQEAGRGEEAPSARRAHMRLPCPGTRSFSRDAR